MGGPAMATPQARLCLPSAAATGVVSPSPFVVMAKPMGPICNLDCKYCYYLEKEALYPSTDLRAESREASPSKGRRFECRMRSSSNTSEGT